MQGGRSWLRRIAPWIITLIALGWVFGRTDWRALLEATRGANLALFLLVATIDKVVFFLVWGWLQASAIRRFVVPVRRRVILSIRGGSELFRAISNPLADAAFLVGVGQVTGGRIDAVVAAALIPFIAHLLVLLVQATIALPFLSGGYEANRDVILTCVIGWSCVVVGGLLLAWSPSARIPGLSRVARWLEQVPPRRLLPFFGWFAGLAAFDVVIQGIASRAFGVPIPWIELVARIPILYLALTIPSVGNFGVREFTWGTLFEHVGSQDALFAYAFATNTVFLLLNILIGVICLGRALDLLAEVRRARREGKLPAPLLHDATDP